MTSLGSWSAGTLQTVAVIGILAAAYVPFGNHLARVFTSSRHTRLESVAYRVCGIDPDTEQPWTHYARSLLAFSAVGILGLFALLRLQAHLPLARGHTAVSPTLAFNTSVSFVTNTSWQSYAGESTLGHLALAAGLGVAAFSSAAVGMAAGAALIRGIARRETALLGNFWVDLTRAAVRVLLPLSVIFALVLLGLGVIQSLGSPHAVTTLSGARQSIPGGPIASWEPIKLLSGDGGGAFNANSAHPFENPSAVSNTLEIILMLLVPLGFIRMFGRMVSDDRQGWALLAVTAVLFAGSVVATGAAQHAHEGTVAQAVGGATEGTETRVGVPGSALFGAAAVSSADGAAPASYDSFTSLGGGVLLTTMMLGEISPGGAGSGLYGLLLTALLAVFLAGLMVGRTPEYLGKRLRAGEMKLVGLSLLAPLTVILVGSALAIALPAGRAGPSNTGAHGLSEILYAFTSATNGNGSAFGGLSANTDFYNVALGVAMLLGRYLPMVLVLALAGRFAAQRSRVTTAGTLQTHTPLFVTMVVAVAAIVVGLEFFPALALGPLAEGTR